MQEDVKEPIESPVVETVTEEITEKVEPEKPGDKTEPNLLLKSLQEERAKRKELEKLLEEKETQAEIIEPVSDEGRMLKKQIDALQDTLVMKDVVAKYPALQDKASEFEDFRKDYPNAKIENVAKLFLAERDLLEPITPRKGLEKTTGGGRTTQNVGMTVDEFDKLRVTNYRKYKDMLIKGQAPK